jgi:hypothetical protein
VRRCTFLSGDAAVAVARPRDGAEQAADAILKTYPLMEVFKALEERVNDPDRPHLAVQGEPRF